MNIKLCNSCNGAGEIETRDRDGYDKHPCSRCSGTGRLYSTTYTVDFPFTGVGKVQYIKACNKIVDIIRKSKGEK
jgi:DnaJ-class molecular chaperone